MTSQAQAEGAAAGRARPRLRRLPAPSGRPARDRARRAPLDDRDPDAVPAGHARRARHARPAQSGGRRARPERDPASCSTTPIIRSTSAPAAGATTPRCARRCSTPPWPGWRPSSLRLGSGIAARCAGGGAIRYLREADCRRAAPSTTLPAAACAAPFGKSMNAFSFRRAAARAASFSAVVGRGARARRLLRGADRPAHRAAVSDAVARVGRCRRLLGAGDGAGGRAAAAAAVAGARAPLSAQRPGQPERAADRAGGRQQRRPRHVHGAVPRRHPAGRIDPGRRRLSVASASSTSRCSVPARAASAAGAASPTRTAPAASTPSANTCSPATAPAPASASSPTVPTTRCTSAADASRPAGPNIGARRGAVPAPSRGSPLDRCPRLARFGELGLPLRDRRRRCSSRSRSSASSSSSSARCSRRCWRRCS